MGMGKGARHLEELELIRRQIAGDQADAYQREVSAARERIRLEQELTNAMLGCVQQASMLHRELLNDLVRVD